MATVLEFGANVMAFRRMADAAALAPSPDNNQPWRFAIRENCLDIYIDPASELPSDVGSMFTLLAIGAAIENACIAARHDGFEPEVCIGQGDSAAGATAPRRAASIKLRPGDSSESENDALFAQVARRCTSRKAFDKRPLRGELLASLACPTEGQNGVRTDWIVDRELLGRVAQLVARGDRIRLEHEPFHAELYRQLRLTLDDAERTRDGLDIRTLELPPGGTFLVRWMRTWPRMRLLGRIGVTRLLSAASAQAVLSSSALGAVTIDAFDADHLVAAGRAFQRLWLRAQAAGLALHPLGSLPIFLAHHEQLGGRLLLPRHRRCVAELATEFGDLLPECGGRPLAMLFRLGIASASTVRSLRRSSEELTISPQDDIA